VPRWLTKAEEAAEEEAIRQEIQQDACKPRCHDCLTEDVMVKVTDPMGFEHWFCAEDWAAMQELHEKIMTMLGDAARALEEH
jgi:hypothetical protein